MAKTISKETGFIMLLANLIRRNDDIGSTSTVFSELKCSKPALGRWIEVCDYSLLMETLLLTDSVFSQEFSGIQLTVDERTMFAHSLEKHCGDCDRCEAKRVEDLKWQSRFGKAIKESSQVIGRYLARAAGKS